jgi:hypothetical protein
VKRKTGIPAEVHTGANCFLVTSDTAAVLIVHLSEFHTVAKPAAQRILYLGLISGSKWNISKNAQNKNCSILIF